MSRDSKKIGGRGWVRRSAGRVAAISRHSLPDSDSGRPGKAVCSLPTRRMGRISPLSCRLLLFLSSYRAFCFVPEYEK